jgi:hypothetical protein
VWNLNVCEAVRRKKHGYHAYYKISSAVLGFFKKAFPSSDTRGRGRSWQDLFELFSIYHWTGRGLKLISRLRPSNCIPVKSLKPHSYTPGIINRIQISIILSESNGITAGRRHAISLLEVKGLLLWKFGHIDVLETWNCLVTHWVQFPLTGILWFQQG